MYTKDKKSHTSIPKRVRDTLEQDRDNFNDIAADTARAVAAVSLSFSAASIYNSAPLRPFRASFFVDAPRATRS